MSNLKISSKELFYLPNLLTYLRFLSLPLIYIFLVRENLVAVGLLALMGIMTDIFDGILARKLNQVSNLGKILDPVVDKIGIGIFAVYAVLYKDFPLWAALLVIFKDLAILLGGVFLLGKIKEILVSNIWGKLTALAWTLCILAYILEIDSTQKVLLAISLILTLVSLSGYLRKFILQLKIKED